LENLKIKTLHY